MSGLLDDSKRAELVTQIACAYLAAFNGPDMRPPDQLTMARFVEAMAESFDSKFPRPTESQ